MPRGRKQYAGASRSGVGCVFAGVLCAAVCSVTLQALLGLSAFVGGWSPQAGLGSRHSNAGSDLRSKVGRNFFGGPTNEGKKVRGPPPAPERKLIPEVADEKAPESNTRFPKEYVLLPYPSPELRRTNEEVARFGEPLMKEFIVKMLELLKKGSLLGLTAPQLGTNLRIMTMNIDKVDWNIDPFKPEKKYGNLVFINPKVIAHSDAFEESQEEGVSLVDVKGNVARSQWVEFEYQDFMGKKFKRRFDGFPARVFQHSYDHLEGVMFIDRLDEPTLKSQEQYLDVLTNAYVNRTSVHYETLGLEYGADPDDVKKTYKKMMVQYHPDKNPSAEDLIKFKEMRKSYDVLRRKLGLRA
eukprot:TRINITY_DN8194_c0_g1_i1.p1 TRINITY_DN8194_c0_g1~~TRINITY_DN8194_c0_g1_i1.p1  ORF type:complete len:354 (+),score=79.10 TRINITY_DN8194_c0_g1_i1:82-1143(+)